MRENNIRNLRDCLLQTALVSWRGIPKHVHLFCASFIGEHLPHTLEMSLSRARQHFANNFKAENHENVFLCNVMSIFELLNTIRRQWNRKSIQLHPLKDHLVIPESHWTIWFEVAWNLLKTNNTRTISSSCSCTVFLHWLVQAPKSSIYRHIELVIYSKVQWLNEMVTPSSPISYVFAPYEKRYITKINILSNTFEFSWSVLIHVLWDCKAGKS